MTVIQSQGRTVPVSAKSYPFASNTTTTTGASAGYLELLTRNPSAVTYEAIVRSQPILYAAVMKRVKGIARNPLKVYQFGVDGESRTRVRAHPVAQLIRKPHPYGYEYRWKSVIGWDVNVHGEGLAVKVREQGPGSTPVEFWPVPWRYVSMIEDQHGNILGYNVLVNGTEYYLGREDVFHVQLQGGSPLAPLRRTLALEDAAQTYQGENMKNGIAPRTAFTTPNKISENALPRLREDLMKLYAGTENSGNVGVFDNGLTPTKIGLSPVDLDLISQRKLSRDEVCAVYDMAPQLLGLENGNYASTSEYRRALYDSIATDLTMIEEAFNAYVIAPEPAWDGVFAEFDTNELLRPDPETRARMHMLTQQSSTTTVNERRRVENLPPIQDAAADTVFMPQNMAPVGAQPLTPGGGDSSPGGTPEQGLGHLVVSDAINGANP